MPADNPIRYHISPAPTEHHYFTVVQTIPATVAQLEPNGLTLRLPAWLPGSYMIRDFARHFVTFEATSNGAALNYSRPDKSTWHLSPSNEEIELRYTVYANDLSVRTAWLDSQFGFFNPSAVCLECLAASTSPQEITIGETHWDIATGMPRRDDGVFVAESYEDLIDYPFLLGELTRIPFTASGVKHELVLAGKHFADEKRLANDLRSICERQHQLFGDIPFSEYKFLTMVTGEGFGGLEHTNSTALLTSRHSLEPADNDQKRPADDYFTFLSLCSHEYFHSWNVKRLKPREFIPYNLSHEVYTEQLWFYEGVTSYYDDLMVFRSGAMTMEEYLTRVSQTLTRSLTGKGPLRQTVTESSQLAWTTFYQQNENARNAISSYYGKGAVIAMGLDLLLRQAGSSLDKVMSDLYQAYGATNEGTTQAILLEAFKSAGGTRVDAFLQQALYTTDTLELEQLFADYGIKVLKNSVDPISLQPVNKAAANPKVYLGAAFRTNGEFATVTRVNEDSPAAQAALTAGDRLVAIDGLQANADNLMRAFQRYSPGEQVEIHYLRKDILMSGTISWQTPPAELYQLKVVDQELAGKWLSVPGRN